MPTLSSLVPEMKKGMWAQRGSRPAESLGFYRDSYVLIDGDMFVLRSGHPGEGSLAMEFSPTPDDLTYKSWRLVCPKLFVEKKAVALEKKMLPALQVCQDSKFTRYGRDTRGLSAWFPLVKSGPSNLTFAVREGQVVIGWSDSDGKNEFARTVERGSMEWVQCAETLLKNVKYPGLSPRW